MTQENIDINEIMSIIPHRYPFLLIDKIKEITLHESIVGIKNVTANEPQFTGHFPGNPVMPGVLMVEAMAQLAAVLVAKSVEKVQDKEVLFMAIEGVKFRKIVKPGDVLVMYVKITQARGHVSKFKAYSKVEDEIVVESNFTAMIKNR